MLLVCVVGVGEGRAQESTRAAWTSSPSELFQAVEPDGSDRLLAPTLSLLVPGAGQHVLGQRRKWLYFTLEVAGWAFFVERRHAGADYRRRYRDFAWENGRIQSGARVDGDFGYYETLTHWTASGSFDRDPGTAGVQPELDPATYNGSVWELASQIFGADTVQAVPAYQNALAYYSLRAYGTEMLWDWSGTTGAQQEFSGLVDTSDRRFQQATNVLGAVLVNHLAATIDAFLSARTSGAARLGVQPAAVPGAGWMAVLTVVPPR
jgi:hypothetical protein